MRERSHLPFQVEKEVVLNWLRIITADGYAIYSFYLCLADDQGVAFPGIRHTADYTGISHPYVQLYNRVLAWAGLIQIETGTLARRGRLPDANRYIIGRVPTVTPQLLNYIKQQAQTDEVMQKRPSFLRRSTKRGKRGAPGQPGLLDRIDAWQPYGDLPRTIAPRSNGVAQVGLFDTDTINLLLAIGCTPEQAAELLQLAPASVQPGYVYRWALWAQQVTTADPTYFKTGAYNYLRKTIRIGAEPLQIPTAVTNKQQQSDDESGLRSI